MGLWSLRSSSQLVQRPVLDSTEPWVMAVIGRVQKQGLGFLEEVAAEWILAG